VKQRVLIVEDDHDLRHLFSSWLALAGFEVETASDGISALQHADVRPPDLLLLDLGLPFLRGEHVANEFAAQAHTHDIPVVVVTGELVTAPPAAAACVLSKPVTAGQLVQTVQRCLTASVATTSATKDPRHSKTIRKKRR
jgi:DNA-binding response OmpR family regulator